MFLWRQEDTSSLRLFSVDSSGRQMIRNFSLRQRLHLLLELLYGECDERMRQEIKCSMLLSLRVQICLLSSVEFLCLAWRNDAVWFLYLYFLATSYSSSTHETISIKEFSRPVTTYVINIFCTQNFVKDFVKL